jgi:putative membrane protein
MTRTLIAAGLAGILAAPAALAQAPAQNPTRPRTELAGQSTSAGNKMAVSDNLFAAAAASGGLAEVSLAELGAQRATDPELKRFSQQMIEEHTRMNSQLTTLAAQKRIPLPRALDYRASFCAQSLAGLTGQEFDRCYAKAQLVAHMESVATFKAEAERGQDPAVKALAAQALPHIEQHLMTIKPIAKRYESQESQGATPAGAQPPR